MFERLEDYKFFQYLTDLPFVEKIILYGSRARQDNKERSDFDIALVCPKAKESDWFKVLDIIDRADTLLKIDCVRLDTLAKNSPLRQSIELQGVFVYDKERDEQLSD